MRVVLGQEIRERARDRGPRLVEVVADLGDRVARTACFRHELVVVKAVSQDVIEVADLVARRRVIVVHPFRDCVNEAAQVSESVEPSLGLSRVAAQALCLHRPPTLTEETILLEPPEQGCRLRDVV
jgi:hypothetical protein